MIRWLFAVFFTPAVVVAADLSGPARTREEDLPIIAGEKVAEETSGLSKREWGELMATLGREG